MNVQYLSDCKEPRALVWCVSSDLTDNGDGTYAFKDAAFAATIGTGSEIIVMDLPGKLLFYDAAAGMACDWTAEEA